METASRTRSDTRNGYDTQCENQAIVSVLVPERNVLEVGHRPHLPDRQVSRLPERRTGSARAVAHNSRLWTGYRHRDERHAGPGFREGPQQSEIRRRSHRQRRRSKSTAAPMPASRTSWRSPATNGATRTIRKARKSLSPRARKHRERPARTGRFTRSPRRHGLPGTTEHPRRFASHERPSRLPGRRYRLLRANHHGGRVAAMRSCCSTFITWRS